MSDDLEVKVVAPTTHESRRSLRFERRPQREPARVGALRWLADQLFLDDAAVAGLEVCALVAAIPVGAVLGLLRASSTLPTNTIWAEDGREFLSDAVNHGVLGSIFRTYNGYMH